MSRVFVRFLLSGICLVLSSCLTPTGTQAPAEVISYGINSGAGSTGMHTVLGGDTVYSVSKEYNLPLRDLITLNNLQPPYKLPPGYRLKLPPPREYAVNPGDTLNGISRLFNVSVSETAKLNNLSPPYAISRGQVLRLPAAQPKLAQEMSAAAPGVTAGEPAPSYSVASVESETLAPPPGAGQGTFQGNQPDKGDTAAAITTGFPPAPNAPQVATAQPTSQPPPAMTKPSAPVQAPSVSKAASSAAPKIPARASSRFMRPVDGKVISGFGPKEDGLSNDGINIKAAKGTAVRASDNGVIAYTGKQMSGYGNLVLIRHADRWMTAYAHMDKILVKKGDTVAAGQSIGTVGATGQVESPQLHFEVRKGTEAVDPAKYL